MIASGGVSGGFSSMIAGGNFMDGFKQGIITSGLNHIAHLVTDGINGNAPNLVIKVFLNFNLLIINVNKISI